MAKRTIIRINGRTSRPLTLGERSARALVGTGKFAYVDAPMAEPVGAKPAPQLVERVEWIYQEIDGEAGPWNPPAELIGGMPGDDEPAPEVTEGADESDVEISPRTGKPKRRYRRRETPPE